MSSVAILLALLMSALYASSVRVRPTVALREQLVKLNSPKNPPEDLISDAPCSLIVGYDTTSVVAVSASMQQVTKTYGGVAQVHAMESSGLVTLSFGNHRKECAAALHDLQGKPEVLFVEFDSTVSVIAEPSKLRMLSPEPVADAPCSVIVGYDDLSAASALNSAQQVVKTYAGVAQVHALRSMGIVTLSFGHQHKACISAVHNLKGKPGVKFVEFDSMVTVSVKPSIPQVPSPQTFPGSDCSVIVGYDSLATASALHSAEKIVETYTDVAQVQASNSLGRVTLLFGNQRKACMTALHDLKGKPGVKFAEFGSTVMVAAQRSSPQNSSPEPSSGTPCSVIVGYNELATASALTLAEQTVDTYADVAQVHALKSLHMVTLSFGNQRKACITAWHNLQGKPGVKFVEFDHDLTAMPK